MSLPNTIRTMVIAACASLAAASFAADDTVTAEISGLEFQQTDDGEFIRVIGTVDAREFKRAWMQIGAGEEPESWKYVGPKRKYPVHNDTLALLPMALFSGSDLWQVVINVENRDGTLQQASKPMRLK